MSSSLKSSFASRKSDPSASIVTVALRFAFATSASSPNGSPPFSSASFIDTPPTFRSTRHRPASTT